MAVPDEFVDWCRRADLGLGEVFVRRVVTSTGQQLSMPIPSVLSDGFLVGRETAAFRYKAWASGVSNIAIPSGYFLAPLQRGHVGATGFVLLEKEGATGTDSLSKLAANLQSIGTILGTNRTDDFALMDIQTRKLQRIEHLCDR